MQETLNFPTGKNELHTLLLCQLIIRISYISISEKHQHCIRNLCCFQFSVLWFHWIDHMKLCKNRNKLGYTLKPLVRTCIKKAKRANALACELRHHPRWSSWDDLLISVQSVHESCSEGWDSVHPVCPSLLPVSAMNMELFCGWELAYFFCLISRHHSHFKGRSTRGLDFLICLATETTTCMWDQLPARADNPSASKIYITPCRLVASLPFALLPPSKKLPRGSLVLTGSGDAIPTVLCWVWCLKCSAQKQDGGFQSSYY